MREPSTYVADVKPITDVDAYDVYDVSGYIVPVNILVKAVISMMFTGFQAIPMVLWIECSHVQAGTRLIHTTSNNCIQVKDQIGDGAYGKVHWCIRKEVSVSELVCVSGVSGGKELLRHVLSCLSACMSIYVLDDAFSLPR
jgi:hypothetical protein